MAIETTPLGFKKPDDNEMVKFGAHISRLNTQRTEELFQGLTAQVASVSTPYNIGLDVDGVPYFSTGAAGLTLEADTDGVPYFL